MMGLMYEHGEGVLHDSQKAIEWYEKAAKQGHAQAQENIDRINKQQRVEFENRLKSAKNGDIFSQYVLGIIYDLGKARVSQDIKKAIYWYTKAAEQGHSESQYNVGSIYYSGDKQIPQDYKKAAFWTIRAAEQGL
ncbi:tetratricopeptide repeat protein [Desulfotignum balticum]|uniref:tetratricopeptide repeat protein n=1 Tax=Desulfotignum balticum TaxID=115781 RepID=UPI00146CFA26|nr:tetratricopeptide repeat protein [Desulfotignum balticum]